MLILLVIFVLLLLGTCGLVIFMTERAFGGLDFVTGRETINQVVEIIKQRHLDSGIFYDLGSAGGGLASKIGTALPKLQVTGIDDSGLRILLSRIRSVFQNNVKFKKENIFKIDVSSADTVFVYLPQDIMPKLEVRLKKDLKSGCLIITNKVSFPDWQPTEKIKELYIYAKI